MTNLSPAEEDAISKLLDRTEELIKLDKLDEAERFLNEILKHKPDELNVPFQRGTLYAKKGENEKAIEQFMIVHKKLPDHFESLNNIASAYFKLGKYDETVFYYNEALKIKPDTDFIVVALGVCFHRNGEIDKAIKCFREVLERSPYHPYVHSALLLAMVYAESVTPEQLTQEAKRFGQNAAKLSPAKTEFSNSKDKARKLRVGYISPDFRDHPVPYFLEPLLRNHDREKFEVYAYSSTTFDNPVMDRMKTCVDHWRDVRALEVQEIQDIIISDTIDILIDVTGHTAVNNLYVFARRAAPVQATWLGFPATTGLQTMDYRITDVLAEPIGMTEHLSVEKLWRLPHIFCAYNPHENSPDVIDHPPFEDNGYITFGCFNNYAKISDSVLGAWSEILKQVEGSRLLLEIDNIEEPGFLKKLQKRLEDGSIPLDRVILEPRKRSNQFVLYNKIDIALDPFPCNGGTTSMDTLWMGVPLVTLAGNHFAARMGVTILSNAGMPELASDTVEKYISIAVDLATDKDRLKKLRHNLRERFQKSPAMDQKSFARDMEEAYTAMWNKYCDSRN